MAIAEADQERIGAAITRVKWQIQNTEIRAPVDGVVFERLKNVGEFVSLDSGKDGAALLTLYDPKNRRNVIAQAASIWWSLRLSCGILFISSARSGHFVNKGAKSTSLSR